ncbi:MAG: hypothetical protein H6Q49_958 [Deltaproteobacteria bacterium]|nr:hypothetical protein [Deltaproteobacteria bacterium]
MNIVKKTALYWARTKYCKTAIEDHADLKAIREKPTPSMIAGMIMIGVSYVIGLPAVIAMGIIAVWMKKPLVAVIGGPLIYAISTIIFIIGIKMVGKTYFHVFCRWLVRIILEKILGDDVRMISESGSSDKG